MGFEDYFSVQVFFLVFRETLETAVIVSVLLAFLKQGFGEAPDTLSSRDRLVYRTLVRQVWAGAALGLFVCMLVGGAFLAIFWLLGTNIWNFTEKLWEAGFSLLASMMITVMGFGMLRINKLQAKWRMKLARVIVEAREQDKASSKGGRRVSFSRRYALALLPFVTTMREGLEAVAFLGGLGASQPGSSFPLAVLAAVALGSAIGWAMYSYGNHVSIRAFLIASSCFLYLVAAGLFSRGVWFLEADWFIRKVGSDVTELGSGPGSYNIRNSVWHVNCCNPETDGPWMIFSGLLGWQNSATYGSVLSYNLYWLAICLMVLRFQALERRGVGKHARIQVDDALIARATNAVVSVGRDDDDEERHSVDSSTPLVSREL